MNDTQDIDTKIAIKSSSWNRIVRERDKAARKLNEEMKWHHQTHKELVDTQCKLMDVTQERDEAKEKVKRQAERIRVLEGATNHATKTPLSVAISERNDALNQLQGWENKWKVAIELAAIAENKCEELKEKIRNLEDQQDIAMNVIKRLEAQLSKNK